MSAQWEYVIKVPPLGGLGWVADMTLAIIAI